MFEAIKWPADMVPSRSPIHFTNELEVAVSIGFRAVRSIFPWTAQEHCISKNGFG
jgi:hypothetical protein